MTGLVSQTKAKENINAPHQDQSRDGRGSAYMAQNRRRGFRKLDRAFTFNRRSSRRGDGRNPQVTMFIRRIRRYDHGRTRHGVRVGLLVAAIDEQSNWKTFGVREKACLRLLVPSIRASLKNSMRVARWPWLTNRGHSFMPFQNG